MRRNEKITALYERLSRDDDLQASGQPTTVNCLGI